MTELELMLRSAGREADWPEAPDLAPGVAARLRSGEGAGADALTRRRRLAIWPRRPAIWRPLAVALVSLLVLAGAVAAAVPGVRHAVLDWLGLRGATVERRESLPRVPRPEPPALGPTVTLDEAARVVAFDPLVPRPLPAPDTVHVRRTTPGGELSLAYRARPGLPEARTTGLGLLVSEFRGDLHPGYVDKIAGQATRVRSLRVGGSRAIWVAGAPHLFFYRGPRGEFEQRDLRLAGNVLLVERGDVLVRLEGAFGLRRAVALAESLGPVGGG